MNNSIAIRKAHLCDVPYLYEICLKTGFTGTNAQELFNDPYMIGQYYAANYLFFQPDSCFVVYCDDDTTENTQELLLKRPQGYILGCTDTMRFNDWMETEWLPPLRNCYSLPYVGKTEFENQIALLFHKKLDFGSQSWASDYPAHLHIDILPSLQGKGCGRILIEAFLESLREKKVSGVHLGVGGKNEKAVGFYRAVGFSVLEEAEWGFVMGYKL